MTKAYYTKKLLPDYIRSFQEQRVRKGHSSRGWSQDQNLQSSGHSPTSEIFFFSGSVSFTPAPRQRKADEVLPDRSRFLFVLMMALYSSSLMRLGGTLHFLNCLLYWFSLFVKSEQGGSSGGWNKYLRCFEEVLLLHHFHKIYQVHAHTEFHNSSLSNCPILCALRPTNSTTRVSLHVGNFATR